MHAHTFILLLPVPRLVPCEAQLLILTIIRRWPKGWPTHMNESRWLQGWVHGGISHGWGPGRGQRGKWMPARKRNHGVCECEGKGAHLTDWILSLVVQSISIVVLLPIDTHDVQTVNAKDVTGIAEDRPLLFPPSVRLYQLSSCVLRVPRGYEHVHDLEEKLLR